MAGVNEPGPGEARVRHTAVGVNFVDIYHRSGLYPVKLPSGLGSEAAGGLDKAEFDALMSNLTQRTFLMRNVHDDAPVLMRTRWALSYLRGPLTLAEIARSQGLDAGAIGSRAIAPEIGSEYDSLTQEAIDRGSLKRGDLVLAGAFGGGLTWAATLFRW